MQYPHIPLANRISKLHAFKLPKNTDWRLLCNLGANVSTMKKYLYIFLLIAAIIVIASNSSIAQRFRMEEADNMSIEVMFDAYRIDDQVQLVWNVNAEINIRSYEVIRGSERGRFINWEILDQVSVDNTNKKDYTFVDNAPIMGEMHYRLKLIAPDGSNVEYSPLFKIPQELQSSTKKK
jgi:hypothetical protein